MKQVERVLMGVGLLAWVWHGWDGRAPLAAQERPSREARLEQILEQFPEADSDKDEVLSQEELRALQEKRRGEAGGSPGGGPKITHAEVKYGEHKRQAFDLWLAESRDGKPTPLCIYIHGGGFRGGDKRVAGRSAAAYLAEGISFASLNYRLTEGGKHPYPIAMQDAARALQYLRSRAEEWNLDPDRFACYGGSAGAGISLWLGFHDDLADPDSSDPVARQSTRIVAAGTNGGQSTYDMRTFRDWFGVPDLEPHPALIDFYAIEDDGDWASERVIGLMEDASPISHLTQDDVPVYMVYAQGDVPVTKDSPPGLWVHHVRLGLMLQKVMKPLNLECVVVSPDHPEEAYGSLPQFLITKLKGEGANRE